MRAIDVDVYTLTVQARNLRTGLVTECEVGGGGFNQSISSSRLKKAVLSPGGTIAWSGYGVVRTYEVTVPSSGQIPPIRPYIEVAEYGNEIVACTAAGKEVLDYGQGLDLSSLGLHGSTLTWTNAGERKTSQLP